MCICVALNSIPFSTILTSQLVYVGLYEPRQREEILKSHHTQTDIDLCIRHKRNSSDVVF